MRKINDGLTNQERFFKRNPGREVQISMKYKRRVRKEVNDYFGKFCWICNKERRIEKHEINNENHRTATGILKTHPAFYRDNLTRFIGTCSYYHKVFSCLRKSRLFI